MSFGLFNALASFQDYINIILAEKLDIFVIVYLDNIFIDTKDPSQSNVNAIHWILKELRKNEFFANFKKCCFYKNKVRFLDYVISTQKVQVKYEKIDIIKMWLEPKFVKDIQVFFVFANFYLCFI